MADVPVPDRFIAEHQALEPNLDGLLQQARSGLDQGLPQDDVAEFLVRNGASPGYASWLVAQLQAQSSIPRLIAPVSPNPAPPPLSDRIGNLEARLHRRLGLARLAWGVSQAFVWLGLATTVIGSSMAVYQLKQSEAGSRASFSLGYYLVAMAGPCLTGLGTFGVAVLIGLLASVSESTLHTSVNTSPFLDDDAKRRLIQP